MRCIVRFGRKKPAPPPPAEDLVELARRIATQHREEDLSRRGVWDCRCKVCRNVREDVAQELARGHQ